jgi:peptide/nickel transport system substrate-binding protein
VRSKVRATRIVLLAVALGVAAVVALLAVASCRERKPGTAEALRVAMETEPPTLCPLVEHDYWTTWITLHVIYQTLVRQDPTSGVFAPELAERFEAPDERTLRFTLRRGVRWHDGQPFTAADVLFTLDRVRAPGAAPDQRADFSELTAVEHPSEEVVVLRFGRPQPLAL